MNKDAAIAANRFGLGARPGELDRIAAEPRSWLLAQVDATYEAPRDIRRLPGSPEVFSEVRELRMAQRRGDVEDIVQEYGQVVRRHFIEQTLARYRTAAATDEPFRERLVHFWSNHFAVSADKQPLPAIAGLYENEAIRPNVTGTFEDLLIAVEQHPAMLLYLDNQRSVGENSTMGRRANRFRRDQTFGLNENLAREILELHTVGVDGGYTQEDVTSFSRILTGWSIGGANERGRFAEGEPGVFEFRENIHEPGSHAELGTTYRDDGVRQGEAVLRDLARHPSTARFVCTKLARHFVADTPPPALVDAMSAAWIETDGDLNAIYAVLIESDEPWQDLQTKYKSPNDLVVSTFRAFDHVPDNGRMIVGAFDTLGQVPFRPGSPEGWPDTAEQWGGADALYKRIEWVEAVSRLVGNRVRPVELGDAVLGESFSPSTRRAVSRAESVSQGMTLLLASPDFQRR